MKLDDEMRAALLATPSTHPIQVFLAGYRMGLERAAKVAMDWPITAHSMKVPAKAISFSIAAAIREMAHD